MDYDMTWKEPTEAQQAALEHDLKHAGPFLQRLQRQANCAEEWQPPITEYDVAEMMCLAESSFWYSQAKSWAEGKSYPAQGADTVFQTAGVAITKLVKLGYSKGKWWDATQVWESPQAIAINLATIVEVVRLLRQSRERSLGVYSQWFEALPYLMVPGLNVEAAIKNLEKGKQGAAFVMASILAQYSPDFAKKLRATLRDAREQTSNTYNPTKCIHPECENLVALPGIKPREGHHKNYRGTGACCRGHASYYCKKCRAPHSHTSKVGKEHLKHYSHDWNGLDENGNKWEPRR